MVELSRLVISLLTSSTRLISDARAKNSFSSRIFTLLGVPAAVNMADFGRPMREGNSRRKTSDRLWRIQSYLSPCSAIDKQAFNKRCWRRYWYSYRLILFWRFQLKSCTHPELLSRNLNYSTIIEVHSKYKGFLIIVTLSPKPYIAIIATKFEFLLTVTLENPKGPCT